MNKTREEFEKLPEIRKIMNENGIHFMNHSGWYEARDFKDFEYEQYINGAWYAFQEQQKTLDAYKIILKARIGLDIVNSIFEGSEAHENQSISPDFQNGIISKGEFLVSGKKSDSGQSKEVSINISKDGKITKIGDLK